MLFPKFTTRTQSNCGFLIESLCTEGIEGCALDTDGGYDVFMPEPLGERSSNGYRVRIAEIGGSFDTVRCSDDFYLMASQDVPMVGEEGGPSIEVLSPTVDSVAISGEEYTVEVGAQPSFL